MTHNNAFENVAKLNVQKEVKNKNYVYRKTECKLNPGNDLHVSSHNVLSTRSLSQAAALTFRCALWRVSTY